jgi:hypothetical protein
MADDRRTGNQRKTSSGGCFKSENHDSASYYSEYPSPTAPKAKKRINQRMEYRTDEQIIARGRQIAPLADEDLPPLITLATGVREYCDLMESLMPELGGEIDVTKMSRNMDGDA